MDGRIYEGEVVSGNGFGQSNFPVPQGGMSPFDPRWSGRGLSRSTERQLTQLEEQALLRELDMKIRQYLQTLALRGMHAVARELIEQQAETIRYVRIHEQSFGSDVRGQMLMQAANDGLLTALSAAHAEALRALSRTLMELVNGPFALDTTITFLDRFRYLLDAGGPRDR